MSSTGPLRDALRALVRHPAAMLPAAGIGLALVPSRYLQLVGASEAAMTTANTLRLFAFLVVPYFLGLTVAGGARALDDDGPSLRSAFAPDSHYLGLVLAWILVAAAVAIGLVLTGLAMAAVSIVGLLVALLPLAVLVTTQFYPVFVVRTDAGVVGSISQSVTLFEFHPVAVLQFSVVGFVLWALPDLLVVAVATDLSVAGGVPALRAGTSPGTALVVSLAAGGLTAVTVALKWTYAVAFCREFA